MNTSPFMARHRASAPHHPRSVPSRSIHLRLLMGHSRLRLMDGVRRWIGSGALSSRASPHVESRNVPASKSSKLESRPDKMSTEYIATALLNPVVPPEEEQEYTVYVDQCQELLRSPPDFVERKDMKVYENAISLANLGDEEAITIQERDFDVYASYVEKGSPFVAEAIGSKELLPITFNYEKWVTGVI